MKCLDPFFHVQIDDFLSQKDLKVIEDFYSKQQFELKYTDLYKFLQTRELAEEGSLTTFKNKLDIIFKKLFDITDTFYTIFASYYRKGDFLSCHDDMVEGRIYAFTFYIDDLKSGDLILFNNECNKEYKRIGIKKNRLVIFEVSNLSFHEVEICKHTGRKAITGWINKKDYIQKSYNITNNFDLNFKLPDVEFVQFDLLDIKNDVIEYEGMQYNFDCDKQVIDCNFIMRRVVSLKLETYVALNIPNYSLVFIESFIVDENSYILLNDYTNEIEGNLLDIFIIECDITQEGNIKYLNEEGIPIHTLKIKDNVMYIVKRDPFMNEEFVDPSRKIKLEMLNAVLQDNINNQKHLPATNKLNNLDLFIRSLLNKDMQERLLNDNILEVVRKWLEPLPDNSLPNIKIKKGLLEVLRNIYINKELIIDSKIGEIIHFYMINPEECKEIRNLSKEVVNKWLHKVIKDEDEL